jgi:hypothetical protein
VKPPPPGGPKLPECPRDKDKELLCKLACAAWGKAMEEAPEIGESPFDPISAFVDFCQKGCEGRYKPEREKWAEICKALPDPYECCTDLYQQCVDQGGFGQTCTISRQYCEEKV